MIDEVYFSVTVNGVTHTIRVEGGRDIQIGQSDLDMAKNYIDNIVEMDGRYSRPQFFDQERDTQGAMSTREADLESIGHVRSDNFASSDDPTGEVVQIGFAPTERKMYDTTEDINVEESRGESE